MLKLAGAIVSTNGLVLDKDENLVDYGFNVVNVNARPENKQGDGTMTRQSLLSGASSGCAPQSIGPSDREKTVSGGKPDNYVLFNEIFDMYYPGYWPEISIHLEDRWNLCKFYLQVDNHLRNTGFGLRKVLSQVDLAQGTSDHWTSKQLFKRTIPSTDSLVDAWDGKT